MAKRNALAAHKVADNHELLLQAWECAFAGTRVIY
jgi:hypothetical protein